MLVEVLPYNTKGTSKYRGSFLFLGWARSLVVVLVLEIQDQVERHEAEVQHIEPDDIIDLMVDELVDDAEDIA